MKINPTRFKSTLAFALILASSVATAIPASAQNSATITGGGITGTTDTDTTGTTDTSTGGNGGFITAAPEPSSWVVFVVGIAVVLVLTVNVRKKSTDNDV